MENDRLAHAIARIEQAATKIGNARPVSPPTPDPARQSALEAKIESMEAAHKAALEDRDRTIAKLRADSADIGHLKDEEIARLRSELENQAETENAVPNAEYQALQQKYDQLKASAEATLTGLDGLIKKAERAENG